MSIALLNLVLLWDGVREDELTGDLDFNISGRKPYFLLCAMCEISIIAVALSHIYPAANSVARLSQLWITLYAENKTMVIKNLQETDNCCGLLSLTDKAWPFENSRACHEIYGRKVSYQSSWLESHNLTAVIIIVVVSVTLVFKGINMAISSNFREITHPIFKTYYKMLILDKKLESRIYGFRAISWVKSPSTARVSSIREATIFQNHNIFVN